MLINNINISNFKAKLLDRNIKSAEIDIINDWNTNSIAPFVDDKYKAKYKTLTLVLDIICSNANELEIMKSNLINQLAISTIKFDDIEYYYRGFVSGTPTFNYIMKGNETLNVDMLVIAEKEQVTEAMNRILTKIINVPSNLETPCILEISPSVDAIDLVITGLSEEAITIRNLKQGKKIIINGEDCTVLQEGINKFNDTDLWEFPSLKPGLNTITGSKNTMDINIKYKGRWI